MGKVLSNGETNMPENSLFESKTDERGKERENWADLTNEQKERESSITLTWRENNVQGGEIMFESETNERGHEHEN